MIEREVHIEQLMLEKLTGMISEEDRHYLDGLLESNEKTRAQWKKIKEKFDNNPRNYLQNINEEDAWKQVKEGIRARKNQRSRKVRTLAIAASFLLLLAAAGLIFYPVKTPSGLVDAKQQNKSVKLYVGGSRAINLSQYKTTPKLPAINNISLKIGNGRLSYVPQSKQVSPALNTLVIPTTKTYKITLSDGTEVTLNSMSKLKFPFTFLKNKREVFVSGEAYFKVAKDANRPFIVHTPSTTINVLGTEFNVNTYDSLHISTSLVSGSVQTIGNRGQSVRLKPGQEAVFSPDGKFKIQNFDANNTLSWMRGVYFFQNCRLKDIAAVAYRWYGQTIKFDAPSEANSRFTGALLKHKPLKAFLNKLSFTSNIRYYNKDGAIHLATK